MHPINHKVPAFSLIEMLVVMVLSSIMVGIIYFVFFTVNSYQVTLSRKYSEVENMNSMYSLLSHDFDRSEFIEAPNQHELTCNIQYTGTKVSYSFLPGYVLRNQNGRVDTLACTVNSVTFLFQGKPSQPGLVDEVQIETVFFGAMTKLIFLKQYDASILVRKVQQDEP